MDMHMQKKQRRIEEARQGFDRELHTESYREIHSDREHLNNLLKMLDIQPGSCCLDLGTGNGYLAFAIAERYPDSSVFALDIAENTIIRNRTMAGEKKLDNIFFSSYDGINFPFTENAFDRIISRYALHHFQDLKHAAGEIHRVLQPQGAFLFSDPERNSRDKKDFVNSFQKLKKDGHTAFLKEQELIQLFRETGFRKENSFRSSIRFPRKYSEAYGTLLKKASGRIKRIYEIEISEDSVFITLQVLNILFRKK